VFVSCASKPPRDPNQTYIDEIKYRQKGDTIHFGIFTSRPVRNYHIDKFDNPPAIFVSFEEANITQLRLPRKFNKKIISSITPKTDIVNGKKYSQIWFYLNQDVAYTTKPTEFGIRVDLKPTGRVFAQQTPETEEIKDFKEAWQTESSDTEVLAEDLRELEETTETTGGPDIEDEDDRFGTTLQEEKPKVLVVTLEAIEREWQDNRERVTLRTSEAMDFSKTVLDKEIIIEISGAQIGAGVSSEEIDDAQSFVKRINVSSTEAPYASTKVSLQLTREILPTIHQTGNEIYIDFHKRKEPHYLKVEDKGPGFGNYLTSPSPLPGRAVSLHVQDARIADILKMLAQAGDYNFVIGSDVNGRTDLRLRRVPWDKALISILEAHQLGYVKQDNILRISTLSSLKREKEKAAAAMIAKKRIAPVRVLFIPLYLRRASEVKRHLYPLLTKRGSITVDRSSNTLIVRDIPSVLNRVKELVASLDAMK